MSTSNTSGNKVRLIIGICLYAFGIFLALSLAAGMTWAGMEAEFYGFQRFTNEHFDGLNCPNLFTPNETNHVVMNVNNPVGITIDPLVEIDVSTTGIFDTAQSRLVIKPGETQQFEHQISSTNIDMGSFIFAKAYRNASYPLGDAESTCGILVIDVPFFTGGQVFAIWLSASLVLVMLGWWLWRSSFQYLVPNAAYNAGRVMLVIALAGIFVSSRGVWLAGILFLVLAILLAVAFLKYLNPA